MEIETSKQMFVQCSTIAELKWLSSELDIKCWLVQGLTRNQWQQNYFVSFDGKFSEIETNVFKHKAANSIEINSAGSNDLCPRARYLH